MNIMNSERRMEKLCVSIDRDLLAWLDERVKERRFASRSHGFAVAVQELMRKDRKD